MVLSTCNRTELYLSVEEQDNLQEALIRWLCDYHNLNEEDLRKASTGIRITTRLAI